MSVGVLAHLFVGFVALAFLLPENPQPFLPLHSF
jgi:hypothetical protein